MLVHTREPQKKRNRARAAQVKPENVLCFGTPDDWAAHEDAGLVKLCDFGLCAFLDGGALLTDFVGSPGFFAPEMLAGPYDGARADVWSLGATMLECVVGHGAFAAVWLPAYDLYRQRDAFRVAVDEAVARLKAGCRAMPESTWRRPRTARRSAIPWHQSCCRPQGDPRAPSAARTCL